MDRQGDLCGDIAAGLTGIFSVFAVVADFFNTNAAGIGAFCAVVSCLTSVHQRYIKRPAVKNND